MGTQYWSSLKNTPMHNLTTVQDIPENPAHRRAWVQYRLRLIGLAFTDLAIEAGVTAQAISNTFDKSNSRIESFIAGKLGITAKQLFPERFDALGNRIVRERRRSSDPHHSARRKVKA